MRDNSRLRAIRLLLLRRLFVASIPILLLSLIVWPASKASSYAIARGDVELRVHNGCLVYTARPPSAGVKRAKVVRFSSEPIGSFDPWPEFLTVRAPSDHCDPDVESLLGFNAISRPAFDLVAVPLWAVVLACAWYQFWWLTHARYRRRFAAGHCGECGYDLRGLIDSPRCPECGKELGWEKPAPAPPATDRAKRGARPASVRLT